jgi:hypothetical protein
VISYSATGTGTGGVTFVTWPTVQVNLYCLTPGARMFFTKDGSQPDPTSASYAGPFSVTIPNGGSVTVKAVAAAAGFVQSSVGSLTIS